VTRNFGAQLSLWPDRERIWCVRRPTRQPRDRFSLEYCLWLAKSPRQRFEVLSRQRFCCWECGYVLMPRWVHLHHPLGYANLNYEEASDLKAVHGICHRRIHEQEQAAACGCKAA
jgi:hypothetical protein